MSHNLRNLKKCFYNISHSKTYTVFTDLSNKSNNKLWFFKKKIRENILNEWIKKLQIGYILLSAP